MALTRARLHAAAAGLQEEEETDELLLLEEDMLDAHPDDLPRRLLTNFAVYTAEARTPTPSTKQTGSEAESIESQSMQGRLMTWQLGACTTPDLQAAARAADA